MALEGGVPFAAQADGGRCQPGDDPKVVENHRDRQPDDPGVFLYGLDREAESSIFTGKNMKEVKNRKANVVERTEYLFALGQIDPGKKEPEKHRR